MVKPKSLTFVAVDEDVNEEHLMIARGATFLGTYLVQHATSVALCYHCSRARQLAREAIFPY